MLRRFASFTTTPATIKRWVIGTIVLVTASVLVTFLVTLKLIVWPLVEAPRPADAVVVVAGAHDGREEYGIELARSGYADVVLLSHPYGSDDELMNELCTKEQAIEVVCFDPVPSTTRGEMTRVASIARAQGWDSLLVVTYRPHVNRVRYELARRFDGEAAVLAVPRHIPRSQWPYAYAREVAGFAKTALDSLQSLSRRVQSGADDVVSDIWQGLAGRSA